MQKKKKKKKKWIVNINLKSYFLNDIAWPKNKEESTDKHDMTFCQLLISVHCYLKMLPMREGSESLFC